jgi:hypothetical protein
VTKTGRLGIIIPPVACPFAFAQADCSLLSFNNELAVVSMKAH